MPHVDEGTLHALLDGALRAEAPERAAAVEAHIEGCADCAARLEAAAELRDRAGGILGALDAAATPDFEEVRVRAGGGAGGAAAAGGGAAGRPGQTRPHRLARQARWTRGVAWAASIVLALGTGYLIRDRLAPPAPPASAAPSVERAESVRSAASAPRGEPDVEQADADAPSAPEMAGDAGDGGAGRDAGERAGEVAAGVAAEAEAARDESRREAEVGERALASRSEGERAPDSAVAAAPLAAAPAAPVPAPAPTPAVDSTRRFAADVDALTGSRAIELDEIVVTGATSVRTQAEAAGQTRFRVASPTVADVGTGREEARRTLGGPHLVVEALEVVSVRPDTLRPDGVVTVQRLEDGRTIELRQWPREEGAAGGELPAPATGDALATRVTIVRDGQVVVLSGLVPRELLLELAARLTKH